MSEANPFMAMILETNSFVGEAENIQDGMKPLPEQQAWSPGDTAILASANTALETDFVVVKGLEPIEYEETYPDWMERTLMEDHVLCEIFSRQDTEKSIGWVHRLKLLPIKKYRYDELHTWRKKGFPDDIPEWILKIYREYTDRLSDQAPDKVPVAITCPFCGKRNVEMVVTRHLTWTCRAGTMKYQGEMRHLPVNDPVMSSEHQAILRCMDCHKEATMTDEEWVLPDISN
jgi:hypothetical protein